MCLVSGLEHSNLSLHWLKEWVFLDASSLPSLEGWSCLWVCKASCDLRSAWAGCPEPPLPPHLLQLGSHSASWTTNSGWGNCPWLHLLPPTAYWNYLENLGNARALTHSSPVSQGNSNVRLTDFNPLILVLSRKVTYLDSWLLQVDINEHGGEGMWEQLVPDTEQ